MIGGEILDMMNDRVPGLQSNIHEVFSEMKPDYRVLTEIWCSEFSTLFKCIDCNDTPLLIAVVVGERQPQSVSAQPEYKNNIKEALIKCEYRIRDEYGLNDTFQMNEEHADTIYRAAYGKDYYFFEVNESVLDSFRKTVKSSGKTDKPGKPVYRIILLSIVGAAVLFACLFFLGNSTKSINVHSMSKQEWYVGDEFSSADISLAVIDHFGRERINVDGFHVETIRFDKPGFHEIVVEYDNKTIKIVLNVLEPDADIETDGKPDADIETDGKPDADIETDGKPDADIETDGKPDDNEQISNAEKTEVSISLVSKPLKTTYFVNEMLNTNGISLQIRYSDGTIQTLTDGFTCSPLQLTSSGNQKITVSYAGKTVTFFVTVNEVLPTGIKVLNLPHKTAYTLGECLDTKGMLIQVSFNDGTKNTISGGYICSPMQLNSTGIQEIRVEYKGVSTEFNITVQKTESYETSSDHIDQSDKDSNNNDTSIKLETGMPLNPFDDPFTDPFPMPDDEDFAKPDPYYILEPSITEDYTISMMANCEGFFIWMFTDVLWESITIEDIADNNHSHKFVEGNELLHINFFDELQSRYRYVYIVFDPTIIPNYDDAQITVVELLTSSDHIDQSGKVGDYNTSEKLDSSMLENPFDAPFTDPFPMPDEDSGPVSVEEEFYWYIDTYYIQPPQVDAERRVISMTVSCNGTIWWYFSDVSEEVSNTDYVEKYHYATVDSFVLGNSTGTKDVLSHETIDIPFNEYSDGFSFVYIAFSPDGDPNFTFAQITPISLVPYQ